MESQVGSNNCGVSCVDCCHPARRGLVQHGGQIGVEVEDRLCMKRQETAGRKGVRTAGGGSKKRLRFVTTTKRNDNCYWTCKRNRARGAPGGVLILRWFADMLRAGFQGSSESGAPPPNMLSPVSSQRLIVFFASGEPSAVSTSRNSRSQKNGQSEYGVSARASSHSVVAWPSRTHCQFLLAD